MKAFGEYVLVEPETYSGSIHLTNEKPEKGKVLSVGNQVKVDVEEGQTIHFGNSKEIYEHRYIVHEDSIYCTA